MIAVREVSKRYGDFEAVRGVSFAVEPGRVLGLLGPNGAGKTSIMRMISGYHRPSSGSVLVGDFDVVDEPVEAKRRVGYLPENAPAYVDPSPEEYLRFVAEARGLEKPAQALERVAAACGLEPVWRVPIGKVSKGFRQRVGIAQAIIHDPEILVLDEPTSGLDPNQILEIRALIRDLGRSKTVILSTHILQEAEALCERVIILNEGRVVAQGSAEDIEREMKGEDRFELVLKGLGGGEIAARAGALGAIRLLGPAEAAPEGVRVRLSAPLDEGHGAAEAVFDWAVANGLKILEMRHERLTLEQIFVALTREDRVP